MHLIFVLYDSITNSIFDSQIAIPLLQRKQQNPLLTITIISFEKKINAHSYKAITDKYPQLQFVFLKKQLFITPFFLFSAIQQLKKILASFSNYQLIARGPLAGFLCLKAINPKKRTPLIIQARGLLYEEYNYVHQDTKNKLLQLIHSWRAHQYKKIEQYVYSHKKKQTYAIEAVSIALKEHLIATYHACPDAITIAEHDIPTTIPASQLRSWRTEIRHQLQLSDDIIVYCYNGSLRAWQCPQQTIEFFYNQLQKNKNIFLLVLTQDAKSFQQLLQQKDIDAAFYKVLNVPHQEIYQYLAAADSGLIFREQHILNWVSRPTKILEYQAVGLPIIHNNTIAMITETN